MRRPRPLSTHDDQVATLIGRVFAGFNDSGIEWALLRGRSELQTGRDTDLLVSAAHLRVAREAILQLGGAPLPQRRYPWHHMYIIDTPGSGPNLKLDLVTHLIYNRELQIPSHLEEGCLERRVRDRSLVQLSATDAFWTILLHCLLDKQHVKGDRAEELLARVELLDRPSPGEDFFSSLCPTDWSTDRAIDCVVRGDWVTLGSLGSQIVSQRSAEASARLSRDAAPAIPRKGRRSLLDRVMRRASDAATGAAYRKVWRAVGLGVTPHVLDLAHEAAVTAVVIELRRRPGRCVVTLVIDDEQLPRLLALMSEYRPLTGTWHRLTRVGLESVRLVRASEVPEAQRAEAGLGARSLPLPGREHCRLAL